MHDFGQCKVHETRVCVHTVFILHGLGQCKVHGIRVGVLAVSRPWGLANKSIGLRMHGLG